MSAKEDTLGDQTKGEGNDDFSCNFGAENTNTKCVRFSMRHIGVVVAALVVASPALSKTVPSYPLRNGSFSSYQRE